MTMEDIFVKTNQLTAMTQLVSTPYCKKKNAYTHYTTTSKSRKILKNSILWGTQMRAVGDCLDIISPL